MRSHESDDVRASDADAGREETPVASTTMQAAAAIEARCTREA
jgi:hypothetical protein